MKSFESLVDSFEQMMTQNLPFHSQPDNLYEPCGYLLKLGGKRVRPILCLMANELFSPIQEQTWSAATAIELFHNFTLIHDDIMDKAPLRRGKETVHHKFGMTAGILSGDVLCIYAYDALSKVHSEKFNAIFSLFNQTAIEVCEGQQLDMDFEKSDLVSEEDYLHMIKLKTSVLLAASLKIGAIIGGASQNDAQKLYEFGINLGLSFQLMDDYLDAFGDAKKLGKQIGGDILSDKKTFLLIYASTHANLQQKAVLEQMKNTDLAQGKVEKTLKIFEETHAKAACKSAIGQYSAKAFSALENIEVAPERKKNLMDLAHRLLNRES